MLGNKAVNEKNHLEIAGCDVVLLADKLGTPLYVFDEALLRENMREYKKVFEERYPEVSIAFAGKAFLCSAMCRVLGQEGLWLDTVSGGEYYTALGSGFPMEQVLFHGNNKSPEEHSLVLKNGIGRWVIDSESELDLLIEEAQKYERGKLPVFFRITPGIDPHTHAFITTGKVDSKFGLPLMEGIALLVVQKALSCGYLDVKGIHCHIGSQIDTLEPFGKAIEVMVRFLAEVGEKTRCLLPELDLGGGLGVPYLDEDKGRFPSVESYAEIICGAVKENCQKYKVPLPHLFVEPGRSIGNTAGSTIYRVGTVKEIPGIKKYVAVDGGMADNPRPVLYDAKYQSLVGNRVLGGGKEKVSIVGKCCETGDVIIGDTELVPVMRGDVLVVEGTGAYNHSMASNYNMIPRPGVVFIREGKPVLVVRPESWYDLTRRDIIPDYLQEEGE
ncbi:MAG: diaminopimelate decarboxylase [Candidatus Atribacteria bacterium]|nr:diaminopimelate decarboxylase [Candidatus Atribacteria bacterium]